MEEGLLSLKWNHHKSTFFHVLSVLREKHTYTDVTLACDGRLYPAHKFVLSTCSEYFSDIFTSTTGNNIVIVLKDVRRQDLEYLLDYMYLGQVDVAQSELSSLIKTAECLRIKGLAIPDDEPQKTPRRAAEEREREGSPPTKKKRHLVEEDRGNNISSSSRPPHLILPPPALPPPPPQPGLLQRLQPPLPQPPQPQATSHTSSGGGGKTNPTTPSLPQPVTSSPQAPRTSAQVPTSPAPITTQPPLVSPTQPTIPVIKQEITEPPEAVEVYGNDDFDEQETKPDVSESVHLDHDMAIAGPSGLQGPDTWDRDSDLGGFPGGDGYPEGSLEDVGDSEVHGGMWEVLMPGALPMSLPHQDALPQAPPKLPKYHCPYCGLAMNHRNNMRKHIRTHTGEKPYFCKLCNYRAPRKDMAEKHVFMKHPGQEQNVVACEASCLL